MAHLAGMVLITGLLRIFFGAKGQRVLFGEPDVLGQGGACSPSWTFLSIKPTLMFLRWSRSLSKCRVCS